MNYIQESYLYWPCAHIFIGCIITVCSSTAMYALNASSITAQVNTYPSVNNNHAPPHALFAGKPLLLCTK